MQGGCAAYVHPEPGVNRQYHRWERELRHAGGDEADRHDSERRSAVGDEAVQRERAGDE